MYQPEAMESGPLISVEPLREIPVTAKLAFGTERLSLVMTDSSIIIAHLGKRGAGAAVGSSFLGRLSGAVEDLFRAGKESGTKKTIRRRDPARILAADKDNFQVDYDDIVRVDIDEISPVAIMITILTKDQKLEFYTRTKYEKILELFENPVRSKVRARRL